MFLLEFEGKEIFRRYGLETPRNIVIDRNMDIASINIPFGYPVVVKGQYLMGGRGKAGAVKIVRSPQDLAKAVEEIWRLEIKGVKPDYIVIEEFIPHDKELYISMIISKGDKSALLLASGSGGMDVEEMARRGVPLLKAPIDPWDGVTPGLARTVSKLFFKSLEKRLVNDVYDLLKKLGDMLVNEDLLLVEINPLIYVDRFIALDSKVVVDDNAGFRRDLTKFYEYSKALTWGEKVAREYGFAYVPLDGDIAVIGNGAGLVMATLDLVEYYGGKPACFLDVGGGASAERISKALEVAYRERRPRRILINIFAGITRCDDVANGIVEAVKIAGIPKEMFVIRLVGTLEDVGRRILEENGFKVFKDMDEAAREAVSG